jgi:hypothetical protein
VLGACPASSSPVTSKAECELAAASLGNPFSTAPPTETNPSTGDASNKQCLEVKWGATLRVNWVDITYDEGDESYEHIDGGEVGLPPYPKQMCRYDEFAPSPPPVSPPASPPLPASPPAIVCTKYGTNGVEHGPGANMYWEDDSDNGDLYTYSGGDQVGGVCQEKRPGGFWYSAGDFEYIGKEAGRDYEDCGGLCCDPSRLADGCFPLPRPNVAADQDLYFNPRTDD